MSYLLKMHKEILVFKVFNLFLFHTLPVVFSLFPQEDSLQI